MSYEKITTRDVRGLILNRLANPVILPWIGMFSMYATSDQAEEKYGWLGQSPMLREMIGGRSVKTLLENELTIKNLDFEATLGVFDKDMRRDKIGQIQIRINDTFGKTDLHWGQLISALINNGHQQVCYDGQYFYDTDHGEGLSGVQDNDLTFDVATVAKPTVAEFQDAVLKGVEALMGFKDDQGQPINEDAMSFSVMVPTNYFGIASKALSNPVTGGGDTNPLQNIPGATFTPVVNPRLTAVATIFVNATHGEIKPFIRQEEVAPEPSILTEGSDHFFNTREHLFGLYASRNAGYGLWQKSVRIQLV
ncbi:Mu-like prophage major head subunit gpT family protein [Hyphococcus sp.]|uniref:Mu-like prophage major head subunit gpT family protein n=1 Tax=Hyphococcus sp. TaxID=2038636 RepID=UPI00208CA7BF|nr:MAG: hypothetical protein DHS20C04_31360 [Marinicaulis sp.]